ncbi:MAG: PD-(D/E)XK nuclease family protein, partial [Thermodesulfovibrionia bacterium]|nr:PD-(D/E)XK nuclease family protein [Thermodesulfovibrionia bacterium]
PPIPPLVKGGKGGFETTDKGQQSTVILFDYKTGAIDRDSLQLPLYACMWQEEYSDPVEKTGFYSLKSGSVDWHPKKSSMEAFIQDALKDAERIVQEIRKGIFIPSPSKDTECRYCYHADLCKAAK